MLMTAWASSRSIGCWQGGRTASGAGAPAEAWVYQKGSTQFWAEPRDIKGAAGDARTCAASILLTFR
jgi:hypothetical protein